MEKQKKIALINDLTGFGRCSTAVMAPIVSAMKIQAVAVPTAILSAHTQFPTYYFDDYTDRMKEYIQTYKDLKLDFDAISTGFLGSEQQVDIVLDFIRHFKTDRNFVIVDPVMGDYGKLYRTYTKEMCDKMKELVHYADIITPNTTEAAILLDRDPASAPQNETEAQEWLHALHSRYGAQVVLTGLDYEPGKVGSGCLSADGGTISLHERIAQYYPGTGDLFAAVVLGALLNSRALADACALAGEFVKDCIAYTAAQHTDPMHGVQFEKLLPRLFSCHENRTEV